MYVYANGVQVSARSDLSEVLIRFIQTTPEFGINDDGTEGPVGTKDEAVASVVLSGNMAHVLVDQISKIMSKE